MKLNLNKKLFVNTLVFNNDIGSSIFNEKWINYKYSIENDIILKKIISYKNLKTYLLTKYLYPIAYGDFDTHYKIFRIVD